MIFRHQRAPVLPFRSAARRTAFLLLSLALAACAAPPQSASPQPQPTARAPAVPGPARPPAAKPPQPAPAPLTETSPAPVPAPAPALAPEKLKGLSEAQALTLLGEPAFRQDRPPARVWVYEAAECRLELAFYLDVSGSGFHVLSHKTAAKGPAPRTGAACVERVRGARK
jgi:hypothetical protein